MKILLIGDLHLKHSHLNQSIELLKWTEEMALLHNVDMCINLGDTFNDNSVLRSEILSEFTSHLDRTLEKGIKYILILGNHDQYKPHDNKYNAISVFKNRHENLHTITEIQNIFGFTFIPYLNDFNEWPKNANKIIFTHNMFIGADCGFKKMDTGLEVDLDNYELIISGHVHKKQLLNNKIFYPGTPLSTSLSDVNEEKGLHILDTKDMDILFIPSIFPLYKGFELPLSTDFISFIKQLNIKDHNIIKLKGYKHDIKKIIEDKDILELKKTYHIIFRTEYTDATKNQNKSIRSGDFDVILDDYLSNIYSGEISIKNIKETIQYYTEKAKKNV